MVSSHSLSKVLTAIADDKSLLIVQTVAPGCVESDVLLKKTNLSRKQYYSRISAIIEAGLVTYLEDESIRVQDIHEMTMPIIGSKSTENINLGNRKAYFALRPGHPED